jgi:hypothetical protein
MSERCHELHINTMKKFRIICPECGAGFLVDSPEALIWERCPACRIHVWDMDDALMADRNTPARQHHDNSNAPVSN